MYQNQKTIVIMQVEQCKKNNIVHKNQNLKNTPSKSELTKDELKNIKTKIKSILKEPY